MSTIDLVLLGVLMHKPMNAYELKKDMEQKNIQKWIKISSPSIYKNFLKLAENGYADAKTVREGEMPEKTVYSINDKGREYFFSMMRHYSSDPGQVYINFCAFISNLDSVDPETGLEMLDALQKHLVDAQERSAEALAQNADKPYFAQAIVELYVMMFETFCRWSDEFRKQYIEKTKTG